MALPQHSPRSGLPAVGRFRRYKMIRFFIKFMIKNQMNLVKMFLPPRPLPRMSTGPESASVGLSRRTRALPAYRDDRIQKGALPCPAADRTPGEWRRNRDRYPRRTPERLTNRFTIIFYHITIFFYCFSIIMVIRSPQHTPPRHRGSGKG